MGPKPDSNEVKYFYVLIQVQRIVTFKALCASYDFLGYPNGWHLKSMQSIHSEVHFSP